MIRVAIGGERVVTAKSKGVTMMSTSFTRTAAWCSLVAAVGALAYSVTFAIVVQDGSRWAQWTSTIILGLGAAAALPVVVAVYLTVRALDEGFAVLGVLVGGLAAAGSLLHAMFDLGVLANDPGPRWDYPSPTDPRGFATFFLAGVTIAVLSGLLGGAGAPRHLVRLGWITALLLAWVWLGRLTALDPKEPWVAPAVVGSGFIGVPLWYGWVGWLLLHDRLTAPEPATSGSGWASRYQVAQVGGALPTSRP